METLIDYNLTLNKSKSQIMKGPSTLKDHTELEGIKICEKVKYLGHTLTAAIVSEILQSAKSNI